MTTPRKRSNSILTSALCLLFIAAFFVWNHWPRDPVVDSIDGYGQLQRFHKDVMLDKVPVKNGTRIKLLATRYDGTMLVRVLEGPHQYEEGYLTKLEIK